MAEATGLEIGIRAGQGAAADDAERPRHVTGPGGEQPPFLLLMVDDLMVASRLEATARHLGYRVRSAHSAHDFWAAIEAGPALVLLGTHATHLPWRELLATLRERPLAAPVLAFGSHQDDATRADARQAGVTRWVPNSRLVTALPALIRDLATGPAPHPPE